MSVKTKRSPSASRKKKESKAADAEKDLAGIPTPKLTRKKKTSVGKKEEPVEAKKEEIKADMVKVNFFTSTLNVRFSK